MPPTANAATSAARPGFTARPGSSHGRGPAPLARLIRDGAALGLAIGLALILFEPAGNLVFGTPSWAPSDVRVVNPRPASYNLPQVPYGIERGMCDRHLVSSDMKNDASHSLIVSDAIGARMDMVDQRCVVSVLEFAPDDRRILWRNPDTGVSYTVSATRTYQNERGAYCREYDTSAVQATKLRQLRGVACRAADGEWTTVR